MREEDEVQVVDKVELTDDIEADISRLRRSIKLWQDFAAQSEKNTDYYRGLLVQIGEMFGEDAHIADDGSRMEDVLCAKVPQLVEQALVHRDLACSVMSGVIEGG